MHNAIRRWVQQIIDCDPAELSANKATVDQLVQALCEITEVELHPDLFLDENATITQQGKAVSMTTAAQCAEEYMRTQVFLRGVHQAIEDQLAQRPTLEILYAGTGPFGMLLVPLLPLFHTGQLHVTLLDIHPESLAAVETLIRTLDVGHHIQQIHCTDILQWQPSTETHYDLIISETMKAMLEQEPQLAIFAHLSPLLADHGHLIPQQIQIDSWVKSGKASGPSPVHIGQVFTLDHASATAIHQQTRPEIAISQTVPACSPALTDLEFTTHIQVYEQYQLGRNQCSLNLPQTLRDARPVPGTQLISRYTMGEYPRFEFSYESLPHITEQPLAPHADSSVLNLPHLKRFWHKAQLQKNGLLDPAIQQQEWDLDLQLCTILQLEPEATLQTLFASDSLQALEDFVLDANNGTVSDDQRAEVNRLVAAFNVSDTATV